MRTPAWLAINLLWREGSFAGEVVQPEVLEHLTLPHSLHFWPFRIDFNQSLERVALHNSLQNLAFGSAFNQSLQVKALI